MDYKPPSRASSTTIRKTKRLSGMQKVIKTAGKSLLSYRETDKNNDRRIPFPEHKTGKRRLLRGTKKQDTAFRCAVPCCQLWPNNEQLLWNTLHSIAIMRGPFYNQPVAGKGKGIVNLV